MVAYPTTFTTVVIANMALSELGTRSSISSLLENSPEAKQVNLWYDFARLNTLESYNWAFARKRVALDLFPNTTDITAVPSVWTYRYSIPTDMVAARYLQNPLGDHADAVPYEIEQSSTGVPTLLTNMPEATLVYTSNVTNQALFTPMFVTALAALLASLISLAVTGNESLKDYLFGVFRQRIRLAATSDASQRMEPPPRDAEAIRARL